MVWTGMLIAMLVVWSLPDDGSVQMKKLHRKDPPYISDIGATDMLKPLFVAGSAVQGVFVVATWVVLSRLRHQAAFHATQMWGREVDFHVAWLRRMGVLSWLAAIVANAALVLCAVFDVDHHSHVHYAMVVVFLILTFVVVGSDWIGLWLMPPPFPKGAEAGKEWDSPIDDLVLEWSAEEDAQWTVESTGGTHPGWALGPPQYAPPSLMLPPQRVRTAPQPFRHFWTTTRVLAAVLLVWLLTSATLAVLFLACNVTGRAQLALRFEWSLGFWYGLLMVFWACEMVRMRRHTRR